MAGPTDIPADILEAIVSYLQGSMGRSIASATGYVQAYADYAPSTNPDQSPVILPYAIVTEGPEVYSAQSDDPATGYYLSNIADGTAFISFLAPSKSLARQLCRAAVRLMSDTRAELASADGRVITLLPLRSETVPRTGTGIGDEPAEFQRVLIIQYIQQFLE